MSKEKRKARWLFFGKDKYTYDTIDELVNKSMGLAVGEVVTLNGYYSADDGATHKRVIADTDDGSGVELRSGKWANIVKPNIYHSNWFGANKSGDVTDIFKKMIAYNKPLVIDKGEYNLSEFIFDVEGIIQEDNGVYSNKNIIRTEKLPEDKPLKKLIGMFDYNGIMTQRGHQSVAYNKNKQEYILGFTNTGNKQSTLIFLDKNFSFIKKVNVDLGHCNGLTYNPKTNKLISGGYLDSTEKANQIFVLNYDTLAIEKTVDIGYGLSGVGYDEEKDFYCVGGGNTFSILDSNFKILKKIIGIPSDEFKGLTTQDTELFNGNYLNYCFDGTENIHIISHDLKGNINQHYVFYDKGRYEPEGIFKLNNHTLLTTEYNGTQILFFEFDFSRISLNIKDINIPNSRIVYIDSNALYNGDGTKNNPYKSIKYALLDNLGVPELELYCKGIFDESGIYNFSYYKNIILTNWGEEKPKIIGQLFFKGNFVTLIRVILSAENKNIDRIIFAQGSNFYIDNIEINQNSTSKNRGSGFYRCNAVIHNSKFNNCTRAIVCSEGSNISVLSCGGINNDFRFYVEGGILYHNNSSFNTTNEILSYGLGEIYPKQAQISELNTPYHVEKMKQEGVYNDFIMYMDDKVAYDKEQQRLGKERQAEYQKALEVNPDLIYEEWLSQQLALLPYTEEPRLTSALQKFMDKYL